MFMVRGTLPDQHKPIALFRQTKEVRVGKADSLWYKNCINNANLVMALVLSKLIEIDNLDSRF